MNTARIFAVVLATTLLARADLLPPVQDSSSLKGKLTADTGKAATLVVSATRKSYVLFNVESLPSDVQPADIANARLRVYFTKVTKSGDITVHTATQAWDEKGNALEPGVSGAAIALFPAATVVGKKFIEVDVTATVQAWRAAPATNFGFALLASGVTNVMLGAKEGAGSGYPVELEVQIDRGLGTNLTLGGTTSGTFAGDGAALTSLNASNLSSGTLADVRLSANIPLLNAGTNTFTGSVTASAFFGDGSGLTGVKATSLADAPTDVIPVLGMVWIKPGTFIMGSSANEPGATFRDYPQTVVTLTKGFWIGVHEVTQGEYQAVIGSNPSAFTGDANRPVETVSWNSAVAYCAALTTTERTAGRLPTGWGYRLPTEAEWEYACRAGARTTRFGYGDDLSGAALGNYAWYSGNSGGTTHPVEQKLANPWGLMDMHGNVYEWCQDWFGAYPGGSVTDPQGPGSGSDRVLRGGSWTDVAIYCRAADRGISPGGAVNQIGIRVVLSPGQP